ncbi:putative nuclease HARBI1 [Melitaea cinxia]|uniref:putative nuclease HARBI1 n=1 Tax=Melitaea cinxia TaxID=113334 RepID=UPI001E274A4B|nr:putative nuclease HARBI1 [Melitaea cinxia]
MARAFLLGYAEEERRRNILRIERRRLRDASDPLQLPEREFIGHFRLTKLGFQQVLVELSPHLPIVKRNTGVRNELKILAALNFYGNGSYQRNVGASFLLNMSQPTFSKCLHEVTGALNTNEILRKYIKFPMAQHEREIIMKDFMEKFGFPGVIGCIDGTHVALIRPKEHEETYFNRKNYHSLNVLLICDAKLTILHVDASFGGASHDSYVWNQCAIKTFLEGLERNGEHCWLLGDSGYAQRPWMMTPIIGAAPGSPEEYYTELHCRVRNTVERCIGVLKSRWRCLLAHRVLHYDPVTTGKIVNACVVLHNIANAQNIPILDSQDGDLDNDQQHQVCIQARIDAPPDESRVILINRIWNARNIL